MMGARPYNARQSEWLESTALPWHRPDQQPGLIASIMWAVNAEIDTWVLCPPISPLLPNWPLTIQRPFGDRPFFISDCNYIIVIVTLNCCSITKWTSSFPTSRCSARRSILKRLRSENNKSQLTYTGKVISLLPTTRCLAFFILFCSINIYGRLVF